MNRLLATTALLGALIAAPAWAQTMAPGANPAPAAPDRAAQQPQLSAQDRSFAHDAAIGGKSEVDLGKMAEQKGKTQAVKDFGKQMVQDHGKANDQLAAIAKQDGITLPALDQEHKAIADRLAKENGARFDRAYIKQAIDDHQQAVQLFQTESQSGQESALKGFAAKTLPVVQHHLAMAQKIEADMTRNAPQASKSGTESAGSSMAPKRNGKDTDHMANQLNEQELQSLQQHPGQ